MENLCNLSVVKDVLERHHFNFSKSLGQNFLINPSVCPRIAEDGIRGEHYGVIEIGTGIGVLTNELAKRAEKVVAIEIDDRLIPILEETLQEYDNIRIINNDVMKVDLAKLIAEEFAGMDVCVCANLPYYITSPIIMMLLEEKLPIRSITVMVQKEAAARLCAQMGTRECGAVTFAVRYYSDPVQLFPVSRGSFMPAPNVDSAVIRLEVKQSPDHQAKDEKFLFRLVKAAFSQRRKTLANPVSGALGIPKSRIGEALTQIGLKPTARAEEVSFEQFIALADLLCGEGK
ncbi:MAG: 16S rRNA (adenine(1518)-N(6)/adenine(1519)-N(6))-dimethyltransferase RsmA [Massiliimalia sp.]|jgi:16S rRNA (adenine1518-N6/adenine1519-N6)-dimethyltransferase